ncbi:hypothetical protein QYF36_019162 [Acer negundo]|nr:hypothetical protein QYF36_019162 [Acer negundo]
MALDLQSLTSLIVLRSGRLSEIISQLQELLKGVEEVEISPLHNRYDSSLVAAQVLLFSDVMFITKNNMANAVATLSKQLENVSEALAVSEMKSNLSEIGLGLDSIFQMVSGMDVINTGLLYLCQVAGGFKDAQNIKPFQGLQFLAKTNESEVIDKSLISTKKSDLADHLIGKIPTMKTKIHRRDNRTDGLSPPAMADGSMDDPKIVITLTTLT